MEFKARKYLDNPAPDAVSQFMRSTDLGTTHRRGSLRDATINIAGRSRHLWMRDYEGLAQELVAAGFTDVRRASVGDSPDPAFAAVDDPERWLNCLGIKGRRLYS